MKKRDTYNKYKEEFFTKLSYFVLLAGSLVTVSSIILVLVDDAYRNVALLLVAVSVIFAFRGLFVILRLLMLAAASSVVFARLIAHRGGKYDHNMLAYEPHFYNWFSLFKLYMFKEFPNHILLFDTMIAKFTFFGLDIIDDADEVHHLIKKYVGDENSIVRISPAMVLTDKHTTSDVYAMGSDVFKRIYEPMVNGSNLNARDYVFLYSNGEFTVGTPVNKILEA